MTIVVVNNNGKIDAAGVLFEKAQQQHLFLLYKKAKGPLKSSVVGKLQLFLGHMSNVVFCMTAHYCVF